MKLATYIGGLIGLAMLVALAIHADLPAMMQTLGSAGVNLLWLVPYRVSFYGLYAAGWLVLLRPNDPHNRVGTAYTVWVTALREAIDRLLPVASIGGSVVGIRLMRWRGLAASPVGASVIIEIILTLAVSYVFTALGLMFLVELSASHEYRRLPILFMLTLPVPLATLLLLRYGAVFARLQRLVGPLVGIAPSATGAESLDRELRTALGRRALLVIAACLQFVALVSASFEIWFALRLFQHPVGIRTAVALESMTLAVRHVAFFVPAGIGVQEAGLVLFGHALGIDGDLALAVSMTKRIREIIWGIPVLISWQWFEGRRLQQTGLRL